MPTLTPVTGGGLPPRIEVLFEEAELDPTAVTGTLIQISPAGQQYTQGAVRRPTTGGFFEVDFAPPLGVDVLYRLEQYDEDGVFIGLSLGGTASVEIDSATVVIQDPLAPRQFVILDAHTDFGQTVSRTRDMVVHQRGNDTIALMGRVSLARNVPLTVNTRTTADADLLTLVLQRTPFMVRSMPGVLPLPSVFFAVTDAPTQFAVDVQYGGEWSRWDVVAQEVSRPTLAIIEPALTYARYTAAYSTYAETELLYATYVDSQMNPPPEI